MSYFTGEQTAQSTTAAPGTEPQTENYVEKVKQTKGEQWQDPNVLAKGYLSAQDHIAQLTRQIEEMREDLGKRATAEEILAELRKEQAKPTAGERPSANSGSGATENTTQGGPEDIKRLIEETLTQREKNRTAAENLKEADAQLTRLYGTEATAKMEARAKELGLSKERMTEIASESPTAFLSLIGEKPPVADNRTVSSEVNTATDQFSRSSNERTWDYYQEMRRKNPKLYYSAKMQRQLEADYASGKVRIPT